MATLKMVKNTIPFDYMLAQHALRDCPIRRTLDDIYSYYFAEYKWPNCCCTALISDLTQYYTDKRAPYEVASQMKEHHALRHFMSIFGGARNLHSAMIQATGMIETLQKPNIGLVNKGWLYFPVLKGFHECDDYMRAMPVFKYYRKWYAFTREGLTPVLFDDAEIVVGWKCPRAFFYGY